MKTREEIINDLKALKLELSKDYPIVSLALFGSFSRDEASPQSDIDILVELNGRIGSKFFELAHRLETSLGKKVDLVSKAGIKNRYLNSIEEDLIYV